MLMYNRSEMGLRPTLFFYERWNLDQIRVFMHPTRAARLALPRILVLRDLRHITLHQSQPGLAFFW